MGGPKKQNLAAEQGAYQSQLETSKRLADQSQQMLDTQKAYQAPMVGYLQSIIGGDMNKKIAANAIPIAQISQGEKQAREGILDSTPAGAGRDFALAGLKRDSAAQKSGLLNQVFLNAFPTLAGIGNQNASIGLQELGGSLRAGESGAQGIGGINNRDASTKASTMGLIGGLAGAAGNVATGGMMSAARSVARPTSFLSGGFTPMEAGGLG